MPKREFRFAVGCGSANALTMGLAASALEAIPDVKARVAEARHVAEGYVLQIMYPVDKREEVLAITDITDTHSQAVYTCCTSDGKYQTVNDNGRVRVARYNEPWRDLTGDGYVLSLVQQIEAMEDALRDMLAMHTTVMDKTNHGASFYDADCLAAMNTVPRQAQAVLNEMGTRNDRNG